MCCEPVTDRKSSEPDRTIRFEFANWFQSEICDSVSELLVGPPSRSTLETHPVERT
jgi:hypothetical protein